MIQKVQSLWNFSHQESCDLLELRGVNGEDETIMTKDVPPTVLSNRSIHFSIYVSKDKRLCMLRRQNPKTYHILFWPLF